MTALTAALIALIMLVSFSFLGVWTKHPAFFQLNAGLSLMTGLYMPDIIGTSYAELGISAGLFLIGLSLVFCGITFVLLLRGTD